VDCVFPILLHEDEAIGAFVDEVEAPVNILALPQAPPIARLAELRVARISYGSSIHSRVMRELSAFLASIAR
jgi:2-methylisocitrate lyase-like PEP mutase family enzyme